MTSSAHRRPVVAVVADGPGSTEALRPLARALARHVEVRAADRAPDAEAHLVVGPETPDRVPVGPPVATIDGAHLTVGDETFDLPGGATVDTAAWPPILPHVRRRWRQRLGLPDDLVIDTADLDPADVPTALAVAAAAVVARPDLPLALALGCPSVVTAETAAAVGVVGGVEVVVGERADAEAIAADDRQASYLSRQGHLAATHRLDPARTADALLRAWGLTREGPVARFDERLAELGTAPTGPIRRRQADALTLFDPRPEPAPGGP